MQAVDTNVLVRILIDDASAVKQTEHARHFAVKAKQLFVPQIVQVEIFWVLESCYKLSKSEIISVFEHLLHNSAFVLQFEIQFEYALKLYTTHNPDFADCLILSASIHEDCHLVTFDKKLSKLHGVTLLGH